MEATARKNRSRADLTPVEGNTEIQGRDVLVFKALNYHGPLSLPYLLEHVRVEYPETTQGAFGVRMSVMSRKGAIRFNRPGQRFFTIGQNKFEIYGASDEIDDYLLNRALTHRPSISLSKFNFHHETFLAHITSTMELGACKHHMPFLDEFKLLERAPSHSRLMPCEISHKADIWDDGHSAWKKEVKSSHKELKPDAYFALNNQGKYCAFFVEADRNSEDLVKSDLDKNSWLSKLLRYIKVIESGAYKTHLGLKCGALVLIVCTNKTQMEGIKKLLLKLTNGKGKNYFLFKTWHDFDDPFFVPRQVHYSLFEDEWTTASGEPFVIC